MSGDTSPPIVRPTPKPSTLHVGEGDRQAHDETAPVLAAVRDRTWAEALRSADENAAQRAFGHIMYEYAERLVRFAYSMVKSVDAAEDVVQDIFVRVWERRQTIRPEASLRAYLFTAVHRTALNVLKRQTIEARYVTNVLEHDVESTTIAVDDQLDVDSDIQEVRAAVAKLSERRQTVLRLRYEEQLPFADIAEIMGLSENAVKHLAMRTVKEVRGFLGL